MLTPLRDEMVMAEYRKDRLREAEQERLIRSLARPGRNRQSFSNVISWLGAQVTRLRCALFPFSTSPACTA